MKYDITTSTVEIRVWDESASASFFVDGAGTVYTAAGLISRKRTADWGHLVDGSDDAAAIAEIIADWADGYEGDPSMIRAEVIR